ncbi:hypothetical protein [Bifidobacterium cuniculi]|uniref:Uncharacterized protein n=1 Tax=Bifidobacterium cuniculi TaxID=1688 RepID=A0A087B4D8_9BIFI|nr:hypothetical protein [Bifidobacterium cuniculi]KFI65888.1 hypothetical protein BCUN_0386 [Bifidobacterium cuniculi]
MTTALGVPAVDNKGCDALTHRRIIGAEWRTTGILEGLDVSGTAGLQYKVDAGTAVVARSDSDGKMLARYEGGTVDTVAGDASNPRIDAIWIASHNSHQYTDDPDNQVYVGVTRGTPAASPAKPTIPEYATLLRYMTVPAAAASTQGATRTDGVEYALHYASNGQRLGGYYDRRSFTISNKESNKGVFCRVPIFIPTDRYIRFDMSINFSATGSKGALDFSKYTELRVAFRIDGAIKGPTRNLTGYGAWDSRQLNFTTICGRGNHTCDMVIWIGNGQNADVHGTSSLEGLELEIYDNGNDQ